MGKTKINLIEEDLTTKEETVELKKLNRRAFSYMLSQDGLETERIFCDSDGNAKNDFKEFLDDYENKKCFFVGFRGTGKSAFLYNYFQMKSNRDSWVQGDTLYFSCDTKKNSVIEENTINKQMLSKIKDLYHFLKGTYSLPDEEDIIADLYFFIVDTKRRVLKNPNLKKGIDSIELICQQIEYLKEHRNFTYYLMLIKYNLLTYIHEIKRIILIFDSVEGRDIFVNWCEKIYDCMLNYNKEKYKNRYCVKGICVVQPETYRELENFQKGYKIIEKNFVVDIQLLFEKRFNDAMKQTEEWWEYKQFDKDDLKFAFERLTELNSIYSRKYKKMIQGLSFFNVYEELRCYENIINNSTWVQKKEYNYDQGAGQSNKGFLFNNITCIRALACHNHRIYGVRSFQSIIPNVLYNTEDEDYGIYILLMMKYFVRKNKMTDCFGNESGVDYTTVISNIRTLWGDGKDLSKFLFAIKYMLNAKILRKSIYSKKKEGEHTEKKELDYGRLYISTKGAELWDMLQNDSVLIEICREDYYRNDDQKHNFESSYKLISEGKQGTIFEDLLLMIEELIYDENKIYERVIGGKSSDLFLEMFGKKRMTFYLLEGVNKSIAYSNSRNNVTLRKKMEVLYQLVE